MDDRVLEGRARVTELGDEAESQDVERLPEPYRGRVPGLVDETN